MPKTKNVERGKRYKDAREARGLTQAEAGQLLGKNAQTVSRWEQGVSRPHDSVPVDLIYKTTRAWLDWGHGDPVGEDPPYPEWQDFLSRAKPLPWQEAFLRLLRFPDDGLPGPDTYPRMLFALQSVRHVAK